MDAALHWHLAYPAMGCAALVPASRVAHDDHDDVAKTASFDPLDCASFRRFITESHATDTHPTPTSTAVHGAEGSTLLELLDMTQCLDAALERSALALQNTTLKPESKQNPTARGQTHRSEAMKRDCTGRPRLSKTPIIRVRCSRIS